MFKKGDLVVRRLENQQDQFWTFACRRRGTDPTGTYIVENDLSRGNGGIYLVSLSPEFDAKAYTFVVTKEPEEWL